MRRARDWHRVKPYREHVPLATRFWSKVDKSPHPTGCWLWTGGGTAFGYGQISHGKGVNRLAHRVAYELTHGSIPADKVVRHSCHTRRCVNPDHLSIGTRLRKTRTTRRRRTAKPRGERIGQSKLTEAQVIEIRRRLAAGEKQISLSKEFGVSQQQICHINTHNCWRHVHAPRQI